MKYIVTASVAFTGQRDSAAMTEVYTGDVEAGVSPRTIAEQAVAEYNMTVRPGEERKMLVGVSWVRDKDVARLVSDVAKIAIANASAEDLRQIENVCDDASFKAFTKRVPAYVEDQYSFSQSDEMKPHVIGLQPPTPWPDDDVKESLPVQEDITDIEIPEAFIEPLPNFATDTNDDGSGDF